MKSIEHYNPQESAERGDGLFHNLEIIVDGEVVGEAKLFYKNSPFPYYYLASINIDEEKRDVGNGKFFMEKINKLCRKV